jgi:hypothetical protein
MRMIHLQVRRRASASPLEGVQRGGVYGSGRDYAATGGDHDASVHTDVATAGNYTNTPPKATDDLLGRAMTCPVGGHRAQSHTTMG